MLFIMFILFSLMMMGLFYKTGKVPNEPLIFSFVVFFLYFFMSDPGTIFSRLLMVLFVFIAAVFFLQFLGIGAGALKLVIVITLVFNWKLTLLFLLLLTLVTVLINRKMNTKGKKAFKYYPIVIHLLSILIFIIARVQNWI